MVDYQNLSSASDNASRWHREMTSRKISLGTFFILLFFFSPLYRNNFSVVQLEKKRDLEDLTKWWLVWLEIKGRK